MKKKILSIIMILVLLFSIIPVVSSMEINSDTVNDGKDEKEKLSKIEIDQPKQTSEKSGLPEINIVRPKNKWLYKNNVQKRPLILLNTIILGYVTIHAEATASEGKTIEKVEFYIDGELKFSDKYKPYSYAWIKNPIRLNKKYLIEVVAYDSEGGISSDNLTVIRYDMSYRPLLVHPIFYSTVIAGATTFIAGSTLLVTILSQLLKNNKDEPQENNEEPIQNQAPSADAKGPYRGNINAPFRFDGSKSIDRDGRIVSYLWNFGDGETGKGEKITHIYKKEGEYSVKLTVTDDNGETDDVETMAIVSNLMADNSDVKDSQKSLEKKNKAPSNIYITLAGLLIILVIGLFVWRKYFNKKF